MTNKEEPFFMLKRYISKDYTVRNIPWRQPEESHRFRGNEAFVLLANKP